MNSDISDQQQHFNEHSDWLSQVDNMNDMEASQVNGGISSPVDNMSSPVDEQIAKYQEASAKALANQNKFTEAKLGADTTLGIGKQRPQF